MRMTMAVGIGVFVGFSALAHSAHAVCLPQLTGGTGGSTNEFCKPEPPPRDPPPRQCPALLPKPADAFSLACKAVGGDTRCAADIPPNICDNMIADAFTLGLLTLDGLTWLQDNDWCPVHYDVGLGERIQVLCKQGCFAEDTQIAVGYDDQGRAQSKAASAITASDTLLSLADDASLAGFDLVEREIGRPVHGPEASALFAFALGNGATLRVTQHHPMVLASGEIIEAAKVTTDASFVGIDGDLVAVRAISREQTKGHVYNYETSSDSKLGHIIVAEGVLVGDLQLQNTLAREQSSIELRR